MSVLPTINNRYQVIRKLGEGGMGQVYLVRDLLKEGELVALKILLRDSFSPSRIALFKREFEGLRHLFHPHIARVYDFGMLSNREGYFFTSEYVDGRSFGPFFRRAKEEYLLEILIALLRGLAHIHQRSLIHNDLKSSNILIKTPAHQPPIPKIIDFGLADKGDKPKSPGIYGTIYYLAPEKIRQGLSTPATDFYALGVTLYFVLTGKYPFEGTVAEVMEGHLSAPPPPPPQQWNSKISPSFTRLILKLLEKNPSRRLATASAVLKTINRLWKREDSLYSLQGLFLSRGALLGREKEVRKIDRALEGGEKKTLILIQGETGVGKSRLLDELLYQNQLRGILFCRGNCLPDAGLLAPFGQILKKLIYHLSPSHNLVQKYESYLHWILSGDPFPSQELSPFWKGLGDFLTEVGYQIGLVIALEDIHNLSSGGKVLLARVLQFMDSLPILLTGRPLGEKFLRKSKNSHRIILSPLSLSHLQKWMGQKFPFLPLQQRNRLAKKIFARTGGNPRFWEEFFQHIIEMGWIQYKAKWQVQEKKLLSLHLEDIPSLLKKKLKDFPLGSLGETMVTYLALTRIPLEVEELRELMGSLSYPAWMGELQNLKDRLLVEITPQKSLGHSQNRREVITLRHPMIGEVVLDRVGPEKQKKGHLQLAHFLENRDLPLQQAYHYLQGEKPKNAQAPFLRALDHLLPLGEVHLLLEMAQKVQKALPQNPQLTLALARLYKSMGALHISLSLLSALDQTSLEDRPELVLQTARFYQKAQLFAPALEWLEKLGKFSAKFREQARLERAKIYLLQKKVALSLELLEEAWGHLSPDSPIYGETVFLLGISKIASNRPEEGLKLLERLSGQGQDEHWEGLVAMGMAWACEKLGKLERGLGYFEMSLEVLEERWPPRKMGEFYLEWAERFMDQNPPWARRLLQRALELFEQFPNGLLLGKTHLLWGLFFFSQAKEEGALLHYWQAKEIYERENAPLEKGVVLRYLGDLHFSLGRFRESHPFYQEASNLFKSFGAREFLPPVVFKLGWILWFQKELVRAKDAFQETLHLALVFSLEPLMAKTREVLLFLNLWKQKKMKELLSLAKSLTFPKEKPLVYFSDLLMVGTLVPWASAEDLSILESCLPNWSSVFAPNPFFSKALEIHRTKIKTQMEEIKPLYDRSALLRSLPSFCSADLIQTKLSQISSAKERVKQIFLAGHKFFYQGDFSEAISLYIKATKELKNLLKELTDSKQKALLKTINLKRCTENIEICQKKMEKFVETLFE